MEKTLDNLVKDLLVLCSENIDSVRSEPKNEVERGFKMATIIISTKLRRLAYKYSNLTDESITFTDINEFKNLLDEIEKRENKDT